MKESHLRTVFANFVIIVVLALSFAIVFVASSPQNEGTQVVNSAIYEGNNKSNKVALMFNVYQNADIVQEIANIFDEYGFKTTFFVGGSWASKNQNTLLKLATSGFEIGNHGYLHRDHAKLNLEQNIDEIRLTERVINSILSPINDYKVAKLFAPPSGSIGDKMFKACEELDYKVIMWTIDTIDWRDQDVELIYSRAIRDLKAGNLILMHPTEFTLKALPRILDYILSQGLEPDIVSNVI